MQDNTLCSAEACWERLWAVLFFKVWVGGRFGVRKFLLAFLQRKEGESPDFRFIVRKHSKSTRRQLRFQRHNSAAVSLGLDLVWNLEV